VFNTRNPLLARPELRRAMTHAIDRQAIVQALWEGKTLIPDGLQFEFYGDMFVKNWKLPEYNQKLARELIAKSGYKGEPIPYRLLNNYYNNQTPTAQVLVEMWKQAGINVQIEMKENWGQIRDPQGVPGVNDWSVSAGFNDPVSSIVSSFGPNGEVQQNRAWSNAEHNRLCDVLMTSMNKDERKKAFARMLEICEREDPAYNVLHQTAVFTAMKSELKWKAAPAFAMDFRASNWHI
jgi:peptide/nickel transport system substrate-binding protein